MNFFRRIGMLVFMVMMFCVGAVLITVSLNIVTPEQWSDMVAAVNDDITVRASVAAVGALFLLIGLVAPYRQSKSMKRSRVLSFQNPDGEVTVSLNAIEEYIHKVAKSIPGIKDVRSKVDISKKGIEIITDVTLSAGSNIPQVTEAIQMEVRDKVQGMLGIEEKVNVKMHIKKVMTKSGYPEDVAPSDAQEEAHIPFRE
ncbi:MAG: alkaline shock response membrane anchor protein AmaP [Candidatus Omnitrophica bacterium]|nr:alkaline shock response membrane anchor protein AmaP [Candidatus Omnitrophota bacterium]